MVIRRKGKKVPAILCSVGKDEGRSRRVRGGFRVAKVIESSHYRYIVAPLLSFALLMIYRKQINDLNSPNKLRKTLRTCSGSRIVSRDSFRYLSRLSASSLVHASHFAKSRT